MKQAFSLLRLFTFQKLTLALGLTLLLNLGMSSCMPACPIMSCQTRKQHLHGKKKYRGQPLWKKQNPRIGERLPKQQRDDQKGQKQERKNTKKKDK